MKKTTVLILALLSVLLLVSCQKVADDQAVQDTSPSTAETDEISVQETNSSQNDFSFKSGNTVSIPDGWEIKSNGGNAQLTNYEVKTSFATLFMSEIDVNEWLKGPNPDEGYVIDHETRPVALDVLKNIYDDKSVTADDLKAFNDRAGEFLGYAQIYRAAVSYVENTDKTFRGISFYNLQGQEPGVSPLYYVTLYNAETNTIIFGTYMLKTDAKEIEEANKALYAVTDPSNADMAQLDKDAHENFTKLLESTFRKDLSFGKYVDEVDSFFMGIK